MCNVSACNTPVSPPEKHAGVLPTPVFAGSLPKLLPWHQMCTCRAEWSTREVLGEGNLGFKETKFNQKPDQKVENKEMDAEILLDASNCCPLLKLGSLAAAGALSQQRLQHGKRLLMAGSPENPP